MVQRVKWIDVIRCFGIFAIYLSHFGEDAGQISTFLHTHHVALFFFISGCLEPRNEQPLADLIKRIFSGLLLPWFLFAVAAAVFDTIYMNNSLSDLLALLKIVFLGTIVDQFIAGSLWFLTCLAVMKIIFWFLRKLRHPALILAVCLVLCLIERVTPIPKYYNLHRAFRFVFYYAVGWCSFPVLSRILSSSTQKGRMFLLLSGIIPIISCTLVFFGYYPSPVLEPFPIIERLISIINALIIIWLYVLMAKWMENVELFNKIGKDTLYLCGSEYFTRQLLKSFVYLFGLELSYPRPVCAWLCATLLLYLGWRYLAPIEKRFLTSVRKLPYWLHP